MSAISLKHAFVSAQPAGNDATQIDGPKWNAEHELTQSSAGLLGAASAGASSVLSAAAALSILGVSSFAQTLLDDADAATARSTLGVYSTSQVDAAIDAFDAEAFTTTPAPAPMPIPGPATPFPNRARSGARAGMSTKRNRKFERPVPIRIIADEVGQDGVRRITRAHGPLPIMPEYQEAIAQLLEVMRDQGAPIEKRNEAASILAPYFHPTLECIELRGTLSINHSVRK